MRRGMLVMSIVAAERPAAPALAAAAINVFFATRNNRFRFGHAKVHNSCAS